jgi:myo-inositol catabolism protein IolC
MTGTPGWRPRHDDPLFILAMDHRESFGWTLFGVVGDAPDRAQTAAMRPSVTSGRVGVLVDERYGQSVIDAAQSGGQPIVLAVPVEASGHEWFTLEWGQRWLEHVETIRPDYAKVLVRDNPEFDAAEREGSWTGSPRSAQSCGRSACR